MSLDKATYAVVTVGSGRGFIVRGPRHHLIITAAHCLPSVPPCASSSKRSGTTFPDLLAPLGATPSLSATCLFIDPISDIAILGANYVEEFRGLVEEVRPLEISQAREGERAFLLSLRNRWFGCFVRSSDGPLDLSRAEFAFVDGMSGSPILDEAGRAIGVLCVSHNTRNRTEGGYHPQLMDSLPGWYLRLL